MADRARVSIQSMRVFLENTGAFPSIKWKSGLAFSSSKYTICHQEVVRKDMKRLILFIGILILPFSTFGSDYDPVPLVLVEPAFEAAKKAFPDNQEARHSFIAGYCDAFLNCFRHGFDIKRITIRFSDTVRSLGHQCGLNDSENVLMSTHVTLSAFGYTPTTLTGTYRPDFETTHFVVKDTGERLAISLGSVQSLPSNVEITVNCYLSPERWRGFGHMNRFKREIIVTSVLPAKAPSEQNPPKAKTPPKEADTKKTAIEVPLLQLQLPSGYQAY